MTIKIKSDRVLEAAKRCPAAKEVLKILFPTVFESEAERASETIMREISSTSVRGSSCTQPKFQLGDIVRYAGGDFHWLELTVGGIVGKVIAVPASSVGVEFTRRVVNGHDCDGAGRRGFCRYVPERCLVLIYRSPQEA